MEIKGFASGTQILDHGKHLLAEGKFEEAAQVFKEIVDANPEDGVALKDYAAALLALQRYEDSLVPSQKAIEFLATDAEIRYGMGYAQAMLHRFNDAIHTLDIAINLEPNHIPAKQMLKYVLVQRGKELMESDPALAEASLERARKLDRNDPEPASLLFQLYISRSAKVKAANLYTEIHSGLRSHPSIAHWIDRMHSDPEFAPTLRLAEIEEEKATTRHAPHPPTHAVVHPQPSAPHHPTGVVHVPDPTTKLDVAQSRVAQVQPAAPGGGQNLHQIPCPGCKRPVMEWAAVCPHCNIRIKNTGTFQGKGDHINTTTWQDVAYYIVASLWALGGAYPILALLIAGKLKMDNPLVSVVTWFGAVQALLGIGLLFKVEMVQVICKYVLYLSLFSCAYGIMISLGLGNWVGLVANVVQLSLTGFMIYLINEQCDV